jgi:CheY-like chemotaxis protein
MQLTEKKSILVIDDSKDTHMLMTTLLEANGYRVQCTQNGQEALSILTESHILPDLIILDNQMPVMDGTQFRVEQVNNDRLKNIPVIFISGSTDVKKSQHISEDLNEEKNIIQKPVRIGSLLKCISWCLTKH